MPTSAPLTESAQRLGYLTDFILPACIHRLKSTAVAFQTPERQEAAFLSPDPEKYFEKWGRKSSLLEFLTFTLQQAGFGRANVFWQVEKGLAG